MNEHSIFSAALDIADPAERARYIDQACRNDPALLRRIAALIESHEQAGSFMIQRGEPADPAAIDGVSESGNLETLAFARRPARQAERIEEEPGSIVGRYKLLQQIGEGG